MLVHQRVKSTALKILIRSHEQLALGCPREWWFHQPSPRHDASFEEFQRTEHVCCVCKASQSKKHEEHLQPNPTINIIYTIIYNYIYIMHISTSWSIFSFDHQQWTFWFCGHHGAKFLRFSNAPGQVSSLAMKKLITSFVERCLPGPYLLLFIWIQNIH